jgi:hypothetical protein
VFTSSNSLFISSLLSTCDEYHNKNQSNHSIICALLLGNVSAVADVSTFGSFLLADLTHGADHQLQEIASEIGTLFLVRRRLQEMYDAEESRRKLRNERPCKDFEPEEHAHFIENESIETGESSSEFSNSSPNNCDKNIDDNEIDHAAEGNFDILIDKNDVTNEAFNISVKNIYGNGISTESSTSSITETRNDDILPAGNDAVDSSPDLLIDNPIFSATENTSEEIETNAGIIEQTVIGLELPCVKGNELTVSISASEIPDVPSCLELLHRLCVGPAHAVSSPALTDGDTEDDKHRAVAEQWGHGDGISIDKGEQQGRGGKVLEATAINSDSATGTFTRASSVTGGVDHLSTRPSDCDRSEQIGFIKQLEFIHRLTESVDSLR